MTENGKKVLQIMAALEERDSKTENQWFEATRITKLFQETFGEIAAAKPVMTVSSYLTHLKRLHLVEREEATDKMFAWWRMTTKGKEMLDAA